MAFNKTILPNGLTVVTAPKSGTQAATVLMFIKVGSRYETARQAGLAHFLEHVIFKGTKKRPSTLHISRELDSVGAEYNAFTGKEYTGVYAKVDKQHIELAVDVVTDMVYNATFDVEELEKEKGVVLEEINMYEDSPSDIASSVFEQHLYGGHALGRMIIGNKQSVTDFARKDVVDFYKKYYQPKNMVLSISGNISEDIEKLIKKYAKKKTNRPTKKASVFTLKKKPTPVFIKQKTTEQAHLILGLPVPVKYGHKDLYALRLTNIIFGSSMSSRLFINIRERQGLCYYVYSTTHVYTDTANWYVGAGVDTSRTEKAIALIHREWKKLAQGVTRTEVAQARSYLMGKLALGQEDSANTAEWYARKALFGQKLESPQDALKKIENITHKEVNHAIKKYCKLNKLQLTIIGPFEDTTQFKKIIA